MLRTLSGVFGTVVAALAALAAVYVLVTTSIPGFRGTAVLIVTLYVVAVGVIVIGISVSRDNLSTPYW